MRINLLAESNLYQSSGGLQHQEIRHIQQFVAEESEKNPLEILA